MYRHYAGRSLPSNITWSVIDRWHSHPGLVQAFAETILTELAAFPDDVRDDVIILFSAHSLPMKVVNRGDPYPAEVAATVSRVMERLGHSHAYRLVWQSQVGPQPWLGPKTDEVIEGLVKRGKKNLLLVPIAFTQDHIETLFELDIEYAGELAEKVGAERVRRAQAMNDHPTFLNALAELAADHLGSGVAVSRQLPLRCPLCVNPTCGKAKSWMSSFGAAVEDWRLRLDARILQPEVDPQLQDPDSATAADESKASAAASH